MQTKKLEMYIDKNIDFINELLKILDPFVTNWIRDFPNEQNVKSMAQMWLRHTRDDLRVFEFFKQLLHKSEKQIKCKHPKKFRDVDPDGNLYCTGCNQDL